MHDNPQHVFWFSFCMRVFVNLNKLKPTDLSAQLLKQEEAFRRQSSEQQHLEPLVES